MFCKNCGKQLEDGAKFCCFCGAQVEQAVSAEKVCATCGAPLRPEEQFCHDCGTRVEQKDVPASRSEGKLLTSLKMVSMYMGEPKLGLAKATGRLEIYDDHIAYHKQLGNALGNAFGLAGMGLAKAKTSKDPVTTYPLSQVKELRVGKYGGVYNTLVVVMKDGTVISFCPAIPASSEPQTIITCLKPYLG